MQAFHRSRRFLSGLLGRRRMEREMDEEMRHHVALEVEERLRLGMSREEATRGALRDFGGIERWKEEGRSARRLGAWDALGQDLRYAFRILRASPLFTLVSAGTLTVAIGATTAVFGVVEALLIEPLNFPRADRVVRLLEHHEQRDRRFGPTSVPNVRDWLARAETLAEGALYDEYAPTLRLGDRSLKLDAASVSASYFDVLGVQPALGRFFLPEDDEPGSARVVLSWGLWREAFGGDSGVVGGSVELSGFPYTVVGVARPFEDPGLSGAGFDSPRLWRSTPEYFANLGRNSRSMSAVARLAPGSSVAQAEAELNSIHRALAAEFPANQDYVVEVLPLKEALVGDVRPVLWLLMGAAALVLLTACANVANLLLFRSAGRAREMAIRVAVGASSGRVVRQLLVESLLLGLAGAAGGLALALAINQGVTILAAGQVPRLENLGLDPLVFAFAVLAGLCASLLFGLLPAIQTVRPDTAGALREGGRGSSGSRSQGRLRNVVVAAQVALAIVVLIGAGLLGRSLIELTRVEPGVTTARTLVLRIDPPFVVYGPTAEDEGRAFTDLLDRVTSRVGAIRGVERVATVDVLPMSGNFNGTAYLLEGRPEPEEGQSPTAEIRAVGPGYFETHGVPVLAGRDVAESDGHDAPLVVWINQSLLRREGLGQDAVGTRMRVAGEWRIIAGIIADVSQFGLEQAPEPNIYLARPQAPLYMQDEPWLVVRTARDPMSTVPEIRAAVASVDPSIPIYDVAPMAEIVSATLAAPRFRTVLILSFAAVTLQLAVVGVYGMVSYTVATRRPELAVRMALGADSRRIRRLVVGQGLAPVLAGGAAGLAAGIGAAQLLRSFLFGISATDPVILLAAPLALIVVAAAAAYLPASRATRLAPTEVLRAE